MNLGAPILDVSVSTSSASGSASSTPAPQVSIVSGGTVTAPGYTPIIITNTVNNNAAMAAAAASATTAQAAAQTNTAYSTSTTTSSGTSTGTYISTDREGGSSYGVINSNGDTNFAPNVQIHVNGNTGTKTTQNSKNKGSSSIVDR